ncbi:putative epidermal retinol dehydrogenase 2 isoform X1 [Apostichopus japonicus]|uniref:Short-chain dehydrogenase/reductase 3 n=1 Tax=Stichopus japonicus TaxID=307972 RepID=A0A2G8KYQ4_STIJA|nr:putative epidermal retinol dehydrogenase 2 isoform X1 [Apostichopus japonicus]
MSVQSGITVTVQLVWLVLTILYHSIVSLICFCVPNVLRPKKDVSGEIVLITGGGNGFGRLFALEFTKRGATVVLWDINEKGAQDVVEECIALGGKAYAYRVDVSKHDNVYKAAAEVRRSVGDVTILVNNAGIVQGKQLLEAPDHLLHLTIDVNLKAAFWLYKAFAPSMLEKNHGHIVTMASAAGFVGVPHLADYCASKYAVCGLEEAMFYEMELYNNTGVKSTIIHPFFMNTGMFNGVSIGVPSVLPMLEPDQVMKLSMDSILTNQRYVYAPGWFFRSVQIMKTMIPAEALTAANIFFGYDKQMTTFTGRGKEA